MPARVTIDLGRIDPSIHGFLWFLLRIALPFLLSSSFNSPWTESFTTRRLETIVSGLDGVDVLFVTICPLSRVVCQLGRQAPVPVGGRSTAVIVGGTYRYGVRTAIRTVLRHHKFGLG